MIKLLFSLSFIFIFQSCSTPKVSGKTTAEKLYKEAAYYKENGSYLQAIEKINEIKSKHAYSFYATHAELLEADIYFAQEKFS